MAFFSRIVNIQHSIIKGIRELLFVHNYLVLPGFGGFVLKSSPAHFGGSGTQLLPASKTVGFNTQLRQNDGILATWLQEKLGCSAAEALQHLNDFTGYCSGVLLARRRLTLEHIGFFYLDFENNTCFEPQADSNFLAGSFGLGPVSLRELEPVPTETDSSRTRREPVFVDRPAATPVAVAQKAPRSYRRLIVPALVSLLFFSLLLLFVSTTRFNGQLHASMFGRGTISSYQPHTYPALDLATPKRKALTYVADANGIATLSMGEDLIAVKVLEASVPASPKHYAASRRGSFEIVLGCFTVRNNASRMAAKLMDQNISAAVSGINEKGMYIVSDGQFQTREQAVERLQALKAGFPNAWIRKRD